MDIATLKARVRSYFDAENYQEAIAFLLDCVENHAEVRVFSAYLGLAWFLGGDQSQAEEIWFTALWEGGEDTTEELNEILATEANFQLEKRKFKLAERLYQQLLELDNTQAGYYLNLGDALTQQGDFEGAIAAWEQATALKPNLVEAYQNQASVWQKLADYPQAIRTYEKILNLKSNCLDSLYNLGICHSENNQLEQAIGCFQACLDINPEFSQAYGDLGYILVQQGCVEEGIRFWQKAIQLKPKFANDYLGWAQKIVRGNHHKIMINSTFLQSLELNLSSGEVCFHLANLLSNRGNYDLGIKCYRKALELGFKNTDIYSKLEANLNTVKSNISGINVDDSSKYGSNFSSPKLVTVPQGFYETALEWAVTCKLEKTNYYPIYPENTIKLKPPHTTDKHINYSFRFGEEVNLPASFVVVIPEGRFWLSEDEASSAVITPDNKIIGDLSPESPALSPGHPDKHPGKHSIFSRSSLPKIQYIDGNVVILAGLLNYVYFHWLFDILPRIHLLNLSGIAPESIDYFVVNNKLPFQRETLQILGIAENQIIEVATSHHIQAKKLIVPSFPGTIAWMPKWACDYLKKSLHQLNLPSLALKNKKRIYISRNKSTNRRLINEEEIIDFLQQYDFEVVNLESMSVRQQADLLSQAEVVISPHGSGLSNLVFCQKGTKVIEILSPFYVYHCYWLISNLLELEYYYVLGEVLGSWHLHKLLYSDSRTEDIYVDKKLLLLIVDC